MRFNLLERLSQMLPVQPQRSHLDDDGLHPARDHGLEEFGLIATPKVGQTHQTEAGTSVEENNDFFLKKRLMNAGLVVVF